MTVKLYHKDVYAPAIMFRSPGVVRVRYSRHAEQAALDDRYGDLTGHLTPFIDFDEVEIVEVELFEGQIAKRVIRRQVTKDLVLVLVVSSDGFVRTVWGNLTTDRHATLDRRKFVQPPRTNGIVHKAPVKLDA